MRKNDGGYLITFEGPEGSGKSSSIVEIQKHLATLGVNVLCLREPGGTEIGEQLRDVVHNKENLEMSPRSETLVYLAARAQLVHEVLRPHLEGGGVAILDRFGDSTKAYQGGGRELGIVNIEMLNHFATNDLQPDLTVYMDIDPEVGLTRRETNKLEMNRLDLEKVEFHYKVRDAYLKLIAKDIAHNSERKWLMVDASRDQEAVIKDVCLSVEDELRSSGLIEGYPGIERK